MGLYLHFSSQAKTGSAEGGTKAGPQRDAARVEMLVFLLGIHRAFWIADPKRPIPECMAVFPL